VRRPSVVESEFWPDAMGVFPDNEVVCLDAKRLPRRRSRLPERRKDKPPAEEYDVLPSLTVSRAFTMATTKLSSKGQIILPKSVRDAHRWAPGTEFSVEKVEDGVLLKPLGPFPKTRIEDVAGVLKRPAGKPKSVEEMDASIAKSVRKRHAGGRY
jgi:AbrB family looped-hinge helix DNA binding protein